MRFRHAVIFCLVVSAACFAQSKRPFTFEDMMALKRVSEPVPSPDAKWVAFAAQDVDLENNKKTSHLWLVPLAGGDAKKIADDPAGEDRPRFSPDGKRLIYTSAKNGSSQIWIADFDTENGALTNAHNLTSISTEADGAVWSSIRIALMMPATNSAMKSAPNPRSRPASSPGSFTAIGTATPNSSAATCL